MSNIQLLVNAFHQFTPKGQEMLFKSLKENRKLLNTELGFAKLPCLLSDRNEISQIQNELLDKNNSVKNIIYNLLEEYIAKNCTNINIGEKLNEIFIQITEKMKFNPRGRAAFEATKHFEYKKNKILSFLREKQYQDTAKAVEEWNNPCDADKLVQLFDFKSLMEDYLNQHPKTAIKGILMRLFGMNIDKLGKPTLETYIKLHKLLVNRSKNPQVRALENKLKKQYDLKFINLDNITDAQNTMKALKIAKENNIPLPESIIITPFMEIEHSGCHFVRDKIIFINANAQQGFFKGAVNRMNLPEVDELFLKCLFAQNELNKNSTSNSVHNILHELVHGENPSAVVNVKIPQKYKQVIENIGEYAESSFNTNNEEIRTELRTKQLLEGLNQEEQEVLDLLQSAIKKKRISQRRRCP